MNVHLNPADKPVVSRESVEEAVREWAEKNRKWQAYWLPGGRDFSKACVQIIRGWCGGFWEVDARVMIAEQIARFHGHQPQPDSARLPELDTLEDGKDPRQSFEPARFDLMPPLAHRAVAEVLHAGAEKYGTMVDGVLTSEPNWSRFSVSSHLDHALSHVNKHFAGDTSEDHLAHAATRLMFALELQRKGAAQ